MILCNYRLRFVLFIVILNYYCWNCTASAQSSEWKLKRRVQLGLEIDNNIRESNSNLQAEPSLRFLFQINAEKTDPIYFIGIKYSGGYQAYNPQVKEDKFINDCTLHAKFKLSKRLTTGINGWIRYKAFLYEPIKYNLISNSLFFQVNFPFQLGLTIYLKKHYTNYHSIPFFDYNSFEVSTLIYKRFFRKLYLEIGTSISNIDFKRDVYAYSDIYFAPILQNINQQDDIRKLSINIRYSGHFLWALHYFYEINDSNNYGFSYHKQWLVANLSKKLPSNLLVRLYAMLQKKNYADPLDPIVPVELDTEKENSNFFIIDVSRSFFKCHSIFLRFSWFNNESTFRSQYYQKQITTLGLGISFLGTCFLTFILTKGKINVFQ